MNRNIILYVLIALLVVVGGTWYALSTRSTQVGQENNNTDKEQDVSNNADNGSSNSVNEDADGGSVSTGNTETGTGSSVNGGTSDDSTIGGSSTSTKPAGTVERENSTGEVVQPGMGGSEMVSPEKALIASDLNAQLVILDSIVTIVSLQLKSGDISTSDASNLIDGATKAANELQSTVQAYLAL